MLANLPGLQGEVITELAVPSSPETLTVEWLDSALRQSGYLKSAKVKSLGAEVIGRDSGFLSRVVRLTPTYTHAEPMAPANVIAKIAASLPQLHDDMRASYEMEMWFYEALAPGMPTRVPRCYRVMQDPESGNFVLLLEDLGDAGSINEKTGASYAEAEAALTGAAAFHARWWEAMDDEMLGRLRANDRPYFEQLSQRFTAGWVKIPAFILPFIPADVKEIAAIIPGVLQSNERLWSGRQTLLHDDYRVSNMRFTGADTKTVTVFDWQSIRRGTGPVDVAYFVMNSLLSKDRQEWQDALIQHYHEALRTHGVEDYSLEECRRDYAIGCLVNFIKLFAHAENVESMDPLANAAGTQLALTILGRMAEATVSTRSLWQG